LRYRLIVLLCGIGALALLAAGCGGGGDGTTSTASLTKAEFIKKADEICESAEEKIEREFESFAKEHNLSEKQPPSSKESAEAAETILLPNIEGQIEDIRALGAPSGEEQEVEELLTAVEAGVEKGKQDPVAFIEEEGGDPLNKADKMAREYGLKVCGSES
jgi:hypothetical protein